MPKPISNTKAGYADRACVKASLGGSILNTIKIGAYRIQEKDMYTRIIDKIPGAQFHKIIMSIKADLEKENS